jgi:hypothetical protein
MPVFGAQHSGPVMSVRVAFQSIELKGPFLK